MFVQCRKFISIFSGFVFFSTFSVTYANCSINTSPLSFASYNFMHISDSNTTSQLSILCDVDIPFNVKLNAGLNAAGDFSQRQMFSAQGGTPLRYNIYLDASYSQIWGDGRGFSNYYRGLSSGVPTSLPVYAKIPARQMVSPGIYSDSVIVTIEW